MLESLWHITAHHELTIDVTKSRRKIANCQRDFFSSEISSKSHEKREFRWSLFALLFHNTVKCPFTLRNLTPEEACADPNFHCHLVNGKPELKKDHPNYYQVQGQLGLTGLKWCEFVLFFQKGLIIQQIKFDELFWKSMIEKLTKFYQQHVMLKAIEQQ